MGLQASIDAYATEGGRKQMDAAIEQRIARMNASIEQPKSSWWMTCDPILKLLVLWAMALATMAVLWMLGLRQ